MSSWLHMCTQANWDQQYTSCQGVYFLQNTKVRKTPYEISISLYSFPIVCFFLILFTSAGKVVWKVYISEPNYEPGK